MSFTNVYLYLSCRLKARGGINLGQRFRTPCTVWSNSRTFKYDYLHYVLQPENKQNNHTAKTLLISPVSVLH